MLYLVKTPQDNGHRFFLVFVPPGEDFWVIMEKMMPKPMVYDCDIVREFSAISLGVWDMYQISAAMQDYELRVED